jgi:putative colanic acid biosysnthesis UDP-glucose lipid carrier transferase
MKVWIEAQHLDAVPRQRPSVTFEGVGRWIMATDVAIILLAGFGVGVAYRVLGLIHPSDSIRYMTIGAMFAALLVPIGEIRGHYQSSVVFNLVAQFKSLAITWIGISMFLIFVAFGLKIGTDLSRAAVWTFGTAGFAGVIANRLAWALAVRRARTHGVLRTRKIAVLSIGDVSFSSVATDLVHHGYETTKRSHVSDPVASENFAAALRDFVASVRRSEVQEVYLLVGVASLDAVPAVLEHLRLLPLPIRLIPERSLASLFERSWKTIGSSVAIELQREPIGLLERTVKRAIDIAVAGAALFVLSPLMLVVALMIKLDSPGPLLFIQSRCGFNGKLFRILKFRTMRVLEDGDVVTQAVRNDRRVTRVGRILRRTSIDELPQLFNVLNGDMSLVGPRPHALAHDTYYDHHINDYAMRQHVKPGLTGWAQINGHRGLTPTIESMARRVEHDLWYIDNWSIWLDLKILVLTVGALFRSESAF